MIMENPVVSVCMITYNHELYIREAIEGVLIQKTDFPIELIIGEDSSTDNTRKIVKEYEEKYPEIIKAQYPEKNRGMMNNFLTVLQSAHGKYIALCEGDDYWTDPLKLQKQVDFLEENLEYSMCFHNAKLVYETSDKLYSAFKKIEKRDYSGEEILKEWIIPTASVVFRKDSWKPIYHPDFLFGDIILFLSLVENGKIRGLSEIMCIYRRHEGGVSALSKNSIQQQKRFIKHHIAIKKSFDSKYEKIEKEILSKQYLILSKSLLKTFNIKFIIYLIYSLIESPCFFLKKIMGDT